MAGKPTPAKRAGNRGMGRKPGVPNKLTKATREALALAFEGIGGVKALTAWAKKNQTEFYKIWSKLLPLEVSGVDSGTIIIEANYGPASEGSP